MNPKDLLALFVMLVMWVFQRRSDVNLTPRYFAALTCSSEMPCRETAEKV